MLRGLFSRLETTPGQEKVIRDAFDKVRESMREARAEWRDTSELSGLLRGETFDRTAAEGVSGKADASFAKMRVVLVEALAQIHEALDDRQRRLLADFIESRGRGFFNGPFGRGRSVSDSGPDHERWRCPCDAAFSSLFSRSVPSEDSPLASPTCTTRVTQTEIGMAAMATMVGSTALTNSEIRANAVSMRVLLIDDDARLFELLSSYLEQNGVSVRGARDGKEGLAMLEEGGVDAVLLDVMMPGIDGLEVCRRIRQTSNVPVLMLTAKGDETDRVVGLEIGADDYIAKPFSPRELLARMRAVIRRVQPEVPVERLTVGNISVDLGRREVIRGDARVELTGIEFDILVALMRRAGRVVPRDSLLTEAGRGDVVVGERTVDVHISHLRQKLGDDPKGPRLIKTVRGVGYVLSKE